MRRWQYTLWVFRMTLCLIGAFLMFEVAFSLGENAMSIATMIWIVAIGLIAHARKARQPGS